MAAWNFYGGPSIYSIQAIVPRSCKMFLLQYSAAQCAFTEMLMVSSPETFSLQFEFVACGSLLPCDGSSLAVVRLGFSVLYSQG